MERKSKTETVMILKFERQTLWGGDRNVGEGLPIPVTCSGDCPMEAS